ncbi:MAG: ribonuclease P protein component [Ruminococcaceae bacterium]|nr:ribonuclease P protein component [Oscillospiraceae bacterium]
MKFYAIRENHLYKKAYRGGSRKSTKTLSVYVLRDRAAGLLRKQNPTHQTINRIGISASKKVGGAVQRNRAKRVIREAYRKIDKEFGVKKGYLIVLVPRPECTVCKMQDVLRDLTYALGAIDMLSSNPDKTECENEQN